MAKPPKTRVTFEDPLLLPDPIDNETEVEVDDSAFENDDFGASFADDEPEKEAAFTSDDASSDTEVEALRRRAAEAERRAAEAEARFQGQAQVNDTTIAAAVMAEEERLKAVKEGLKRQLKQAIEDGDAGAQADIYEQMTEAKAREYQLNSAKQELANRRQAASQQPSSVPVHPKTNQWVDRNPWFNDPKHEDARDYAMVVEHKLLQSGLTPASDQYWAEIDKRVKKAFPELSAPRRAAPRGASPVVRETGASRPGQKARVHLTPAQVEFARKNNIPLEELAREVRKLQRMEPN